MDPMAHATGSRSARRTAHERNTGTSRTLFGLALLLAACSSPSGPSEQAQVPAPEAQTEAAGPRPPHRHRWSKRRPPRNGVADATPSAAAPSQETVPTAAPLPVAQTAAPAREPAPTAPVKIPTPAAAPAAASSLVAAAPASTPKTAEMTTVTPAPVTAAIPALADRRLDRRPAAKPGLKRIGAEACGECHEVQFDSWASSATRAHAAARLRGLPRAGQRVQGDVGDEGPAKARAAGLVMPDKAFCAQCHKKGVDDAFMKKAHAHEE